MKIEGYTLGEAKVTNELGIHARPSAYILKKCKPYRNEQNKPKVEIYLAKKDSVNDRHSCHDILELMTLEASKGTELVVLVKGENKESKRICDEISKLVSSKMDEAYERSEKEDKKWWQRLWPMKYHYSRI